MSGAELLRSLEARGVSFTVEGANLKTRGPRAALTPEVLGEVGALKSEIVEALFDREERVALQGCPDGISAAKWERVMSNPAIQKLQSLGLCHSIVEVTTAKKEREAA